MHILCVCIYTYIITDPAHEAAMIVVDIHNGDFRETTGKNSQKSAPQPVCTVNLVMS